MNLQEIRARLDAATPGPWTVKHEKFGSGVIAGRTRFGSNTIANCSAPKTAEFIAHAPEDMARLLNALKAVGGLHKPESSFTPDGTVEDCQECEIPYPCPTIEKIREALK